MCDDFKPTKECLDMLTAMSIYDILKDRPSAEVMTILSTVLDFHEIHNADTNRVDVIGSLDMISSMHYVMSFEHNREDSYEHCKKDLAYWEENWRDILHATEEAKDGEK